ncbi:MAG: SAF domain-containing protein [Myxococcaceae bacterium]
MNEEKGLNEAVVGFVVGLMVIGGVGGLAGFFWVKRTETRIRRGWNLVPVLVARTDLSGGTQLKLDDLAEGAIPEQFVNDSVIKQADAKRVIGLTTPFPLKAGDPIRWSLFTAEDPGHRREFDVALMCSSAAPLGETYSLVTQLRDEVQGGGR